MNEDDEQDIWDTLRSRGFDPTHTLPMAMISRIQDIGRSEEKIRVMMDDPIFETLSKHNPYWESEIEEVDDKLHDIRCKLGMMHDNLCDIWEILSNPEDR